MTTLKFVRSVWDAFRKSSGLEPRLLNELRVIDAKPGRVKLEMDVQKEHTNRLGSLHGGTIASIVDLGGSLAIASRGLFATGVSTDLSVTYLKSGGGVGGRIRAEIECDKLGKSLAYTSIKFFNAKDELFARGSHTKYIAMAWDDPKNAIDKINSDKKGDL